MRLATTITALTTAAALLVAGCEKSTPGTPAPGASAGTTTAAAWIATSAPANPVAVRDAKADVAEGDTITVRGRIGGRIDPITKGVATFIIVDLRIPSCADMEEDHCRTPWDYCCEPPQSLTANSATVQVVDDKGLPLRTDITAHGFKPLDEVIVVGTVGARPTAETLVIRATAVHRVASTGHDTDTHEGGDHDHDHDHG